MPRILTYNEIAEHIYSISFARTAIKVTSKNKENHLEQRLHRNHTGARAKNLS